MKKTFEDLANFAVAKKSFMVKEQGSNLLIHLYEAPQFDIEIECETPTVPGIRDVKKVKFVKEDLKNAQPVYEKNKFMIELLDKNG